MNLDMTTVATVATIAQQTQLVLGWAVLLGFVLGAVMQYAHVCTMGAISDAVLFGSWARLRLLALALAIAIVGTQGLAALKVIDLSQSLYANPRILWVSHIVGGMCFGVGMVLAGGCATKTLLRVGGGSLKALSVLIVMAISAAMTLRGLFSVVRSHYLVTVVWVLPQFDMGGFVGISPLIFAALMAAGLAVFALYTRDSRRFKAIVPAIIIGSLIVAAWYLSGVMAYVPEHPDTLEPAFLTSYSKRMETVSFVAPSASWLNYLLLFSDTSQALTMGMMIVLGVVLGAWAVSYRQKTMTLELFTQASDWLKHMAGAVLMGFGGVLGMGCSISQGLGGLSTGSIASLMTVVSIGIGAVLALKCLLWRR